ncbi:MULTISPECIES: SpoIIE family protein phosphatase [unclassified Sedimentibacter]|uniref:SpoIIE family protein phosphatase n=1 Tax=unclassified Sedimentibacter TaxID=2649220 RepID=UPI0027DF7A81|nr:SpoIIE family protein phosphatase [Sedimentibacter sp. MB35-C1]WMJ77168.1 SpoIIE family protein phosphatase [Sedimentibacter sp. MB35-C1]
MENIKLNETQLRIVDGMIDWVRVVDNNNTVLYANRKMREELGEIVGKKCFDVFCSEKKCGNCISRKTIEHGVIMKKEAAVGNRTFMVISSPIQDIDKKTVCAVEVFRDITNEKILSKKINERNRKMSEDIKFARNMQIRMLPPKGMYNGLSIDYLYESSESLSGDFFDVFKIDDENTGVYICDVVGHGVTASLLTVFVRQSLRTIAKGNKSIDKIMKELHKTFLSLNLDYDKYFSVFFGVYNKETHVLRYANAGHNSEPILLRTNSEISLLKSKGYPIANIFDNVSYDENNISLSVGDKLFLYTDGITEAKNCENKQYGVESLANIIKGGGSILKNLEKSLVDYCKIHKDDYAILMAEII